ncbi:MAG: hypothetical protein Pg6B_09240 [Candidatus Azobacteroides pseudotrichonymphae]|jgi:hypothetical protein|nr:MAG: hypothetical protein Pg6B_09240 [Candidatus Azobacteroides pseudotrichonymphae]
MAIISEEMIMDFVDGYEALEDLSEDKKYTAVEASIDF